MHSRAIAALAVIVSMLGVAFVGFPHAEAAPPQPHNFWGIARDSTATLLPLGTRITTWIDGVDYSNGTSVFDVLGNYNVDVFGDNQTNSTSGGDNTPTIKTGGDSLDEIMYVAGDMTTYKALNPQQVFTAKDFWGVPTTGQSENLDLTLAAAGSQPSLPKIGRITTQPADGLSQYLYLCNPTSSPIDASLYHLEKPVPGSFSGPTHPLTGIIGPFGGIRYVNLTMWAPTLLTTTGDGLKLLWDNPGGPAFQGSDIIVDRVEYNGTFSATFVEPVNTIMTDAAAPGPGQEISRIGSDRCQDTNSNSLDFGLRAATPRPAAGNIPPSVALSTPSGGEDWTGNTLHTIFWNQSDLEDSSLTVAIALSINSGASFPFALPGGVFANSPPPSQIWNVNCENALGTAMIRIDVFDSGGLTAQSFSNLFSLDCTAPTLASTIPPDMQTGVNVNTDVTLTFSEAMNQVATSGSISFAPVVIFTTTWGPAQTVTVNPTGALLGSTMYTVTMSCAAKDVSDTGNVLAACPRTFSFTTGIAAFAPTVDLTAPNGGEMWTGGSPHNIVWTMSDADTPGALTVTLVYSINNGATWSPVTAPFPRIQGLNIFAWTVPCPSTTFALVRASVSDGALFSNDTSAFTFTIDCTAPTVLSTSPANIANNVRLAAPIVIVFSEPMDQPTVTTPPAFTIAPAVSGISFLWLPPAPEDTLQVTHNDFATCTQYTVTVAATAEDLSDPGNQMGTPFTWTFNSACAPTVNIVAPGGGEVFSCASSQTLSFTVTDSADANVFVWINWTTLVQPPISLRTSRPTGIQPINLPFNVPFANGSAGIVVTAQDSTNLNHFDSVSFTIDCTPPSVLSSVPADTATNVAVTASFVITFSEPMDPTTTNASISLAPAAGTLTFTWTSTSVVRVDHVQAMVTSTSYTLHVSGVAKDTSDTGNALNPEYTATFTTSATGAVTADAGGPYGGPAGSSVRLDGSGSTASLAIDNYTWEVSLQGTLIGTFYVVDPLVRFATVGTYDITLTVRDVNGNFDTDTATATISPGNVGTNFFADYWWLFLVLIIAVLIALFFLLGKRRKKEEQPMPPEVPPEEVEVTPPTRAAPARPLPPPPAGMPATARGSPRTRECPSCGTILDATDTECFMCGTKL